MLNIKRFILVFTFLILGLSQISSNPFRNKKEEVPMVRNSGSSPYFVELQMEFREKMAKLFTRVKEDKESNTLLLLLSIGFLYGVIHAAGPGHRKSVLFSIFLSNKSKWWEPGVSGILSASLHGISAVVLILIFKEFSARLLTTRVETLSKYLETGSFILLLLLAIILLASKAYSLINSQNRTREIKKSNNFYFTVLLTSIFPCPGAILILVLTLSLNILNIGIITVLSLSMGMGLTISLTAYLGRAGRVGIFRALKSKEGVIEKFSDTLELLGYIFLSIFSLWMISPLLF